jgi:hypothetical protein
MSAPSYIPHMSMPHQTKTMTLRLDHAPSHLKDLRTQSGWAKEVYKDAGIMMQTGQPIYKNSQLASKLSPQVITTTVN